MILPYTIWIKWYLIGEISKQDVGVVATTTYKGNMILNFVQFR